MTREELRLHEAQDRTAHWKRWGPYLAERQWGTVREDYSPHGTAWDSFPHDHARSRASRWGEDGIAGISDNHGRLCFALALWNGRDPILKERLFGLTGSEGNHGEDVKEYYFYLDSTPTHSYMTFLYKYPQAAFPYRDLVDTNRQRARHAPEYELIDTGVFDDDRYFDVMVEYAKASPDGLLIRISATNQGPEPAELHLLPTLWFRTTWSWGASGGERPALRAVHGRPTTIEARHAGLGTRWLHCDGGPDLLFTENETNWERLWEVANAGPYVKDGINDYVVNGRTDAVNPKMAGTKAAARYRMVIAPGAKTPVRLRLTDVSPTGDRSGDPFAEFERVVARRRDETDEFYAAIIPTQLSADGRNVMRQALAGLLWSKQFYHYDVGRWLDGDPGDPPPARKGRSRVPGEGVPQAPPQLHVVGQSQGRRGQERLPRRLPRPRQHRCLRPFGGAPDGRPPRAVRRHVVDGDVLPQHAGDRAGAGAGRPRLRGCRVEVLRALRLHRPRYARSRRRGLEPVGRAGRILLRRAPHRRPARPDQGALAGGADAAARRSGDRTRDRRQAARLQAPDAVVHRQPS